MRQRRLRGLLVLSAVSALLVPTTAILAEAAPATASSFVVDAETLPNGAGAAGTLDLTKAGTTDWVHVAGSGNNRRQNTTPVIDVTNLHPQTAVGTLGDSPFSYRWSDGRPTATNDGTSTGGVFSYDHSTVGPTTAFDAGYRVAVPAADTTRTLTVVGGVWQAAATVSLTTTSGTSPVWQQPVSASGTPQVQRYTVIVPPGEPAVLTTTLTETRNPEGNVSLAAVALADTVSAQPTVTLTTRSTPSTMDLTALGTTDWIHLNGSTLNRSAAGSGALVPRNRGNRGISPQGDNPVRYSWSNGTPTTNEPGTTTGGVFLADSDDLSRPAGWDLTVAASDRPQTLQFVAGVWQAAATVTVTTGGSTTTAVSNTELSAGGSALSRLFTITLPVGEASTVTAQLTSRANGDGNVTLAGATLAPTPSAAAALRSLLEEIDRTDTPAADPATLAQLDREVTAAGTVLAGQPTDTDVRLALARLTTAWNAAQHSAAAARYTFQSNPGLVSSFGWEGDHHAPIASIDGSYRLRDHDNLTITFGVPDIPGTIDWRNAEGYLPAFVSTYSKGGLRHSVQSFADEVVVGGKRFEVAYSRMTTTNTTTGALPLPRVSKALVGLNSATTADSIAAGHTVVRDYAVGADRFGGTYDWPSNAQLALLGGYDQHYNHMRSYWNTRLAAIANIKDLPDPKLVDAYKAGYIYTLIIRDDINGKKELHVGENGYDEMFDHDTIGIVSTLLTVGDYTYAQDYLSTLPAQLQYDDAKWKFSWPFALYLQRTGDAAFVRSQFDKIKKNTHTIEADRINGGTGIIKKTVAIDSEGYWTIDNWSALAGLTTYRWLAQQLGEDSEAAWAKAEYDDLYKVVSDQLRKTMTDYQLNYIPISMVEPNEQGPRKDPRDANWASMFLFGQWAWDGYLFGAQQSGFMLDDIDRTYTHGFQRRESLTDTVYNFGGYPHGYFSSAYNAGYGSTALRGEQYRDAGIRGYEFMVNKSQSGPFGWWEGVGYPNASSPWNIQHAAGGGGSNQHMWGQATATKVLFDSLIAQKSDGTLIVGRGAPEDWVAAGKRIALDNYPTLGGGRVGYTTSSTGNQVTFTFSGDVGSATAFSIELLGLKGNVAAVSVPKAVVDEAAGTVRVPASTKRVTITLRHQVDVDHTALSPAITGKAKVGSALTAKVNSGWQAIGYQWTRNGVPVTGATGASYTPTNADLGARIGVRVSADRAHAYTTTVTAPEVGPVLGPPIGG